MDKRWTPKAYLFVGWSLGILTCAIGAWFWVFSFGGKFVVGF